MSKFVMPVMLCVLAALSLAFPAKAAPHIVVETTTGKVLDRKQAFDKWYPASLTKLMTAYVVFHEVKAGKISLRSPVKISPYALSQPPSKMGFPVGTVMTVDAALKMLMVKSANDVSVATAEAVAGSERAFVEQMNAHAQRLGMKDTRFTNPHGLHDTKQYTTARDMAILARALKKDFAKHNDYFKIPAIRHGKRTLQNHNPLIQRFPGANGMKTGYLCASGLNIVGSARRGGRDLIVVVLGGPTGQERNVRAARLLFESFRKSSLFVTEKIDTLKPRGIVNTRPVDMREQVCKKKRKKQQAKSTEAASVFALKKPTLDELEQKYLKPVGHNTRVDRIKLGGADGPDPFGLVRLAESSNSLSYAEAGGDIPWPIVHGTRKVPVPLPTRRPKR